MRKILAVLLAAGILLGIGSTASAYEPADPVLGKDSVTSYHITPGGITQQGDFSTDIMNLLRTPKADSVTSWSVVPGSLKETDLAPEVQAKLNRPDPAELFGKLVYSIGADYKPIERIGGSYATRATELTAFNLPQDPAIYRLDIKAVFDRLNYTEDGYVVPTTDTYLQLTVRCENEYGESGEDDNGTIMGTAISHKGKIELTGATTAVVGVTDPDNRRKCHVRIFGYNEDESAFGGTDYPATPTAQFKAATEIRVYRVS